jgi:hypothetical protein
MSPRGGLRPPPLVLERQAILNHATARLGDPVWADGGASVTPDTLASILVRVACFLAAGFFIAGPLFTAGRVHIVMLLFAAPFILAGLAPRLLGPTIGKGLAFVATLYAFYDPPSSFAFYPQRLAEMIPFFALALMLAVPDVPQALARVLVKE